MTDQLALFAGAPAPADLPPKVGDILRAARSLGVRIVRGHWGLAYDHRRRWVLTGDCCCALAAYLVANEVVALKEDAPHTSAIPSVARALGIHVSDVRSFVDGFDCKKENDGSRWFEYGQRVARELGVE